MSAADDGLLLNFAPAGPGGARQPKRSSSAGAKGHKQRQTHQQGARASLMSSSSQLERSRAEQRVDSDGAGPSKLAIPTQENGKEGRQQRLASARYHPLQSSPRQIAPGNRTTGTSTGVPRSSSSPDNGTRFSRHVPTNEQHSQDRSRKGNTGVISSLFARDEGLRDNKGEESSTSAPKVAPTNAPSIDSAFPSLGLDPLLSVHLASDKLGIKRPTNIQQSALPFLLHSQSQEHTPEPMQRDALIHAQTGSGKTLCYLLPIIQSLLPLCQTSWIDRSCLGTLAIILAPTRELASQIHDVVVSLTNLSLSTMEDAHGNQGEKNEADGASVRRTRWIVPGLLSGGATKNHEKSRLRKGLPIIVATPGRLLDHLRNTAALDVGRLQWLVLDEADRLLEMGFEQTLNDILKAIDGRRRAACEAQRLRMRDELGNQVTDVALHEQNVVDTFGEPWWRHARRTILCSATLDERVQVLAGKSLNNARIIRDVADAASDKSGIESRDAIQLAGKKAVSAPGQLVQNVVIVPPKQRLVTLVALLRRAIAIGKTPKIMVFLSCTDSVDFHLQVLAGVNMAKGAGKTGQEEEGCVSIDMSKRQHPSQLLPSASLFRLHGSLPQQERHASLRQFASCAEASILLCTSVASRGLDLDVTHVIQLDAPTEKGADEYLHRIGRTARAGQDGESWLILLPNEEGCLAHYKAEMSSASGEDTSGHDASKSSAGLQRREVASVLRDGFGGKEADVQQVQTRATDAQMALERWTLARESNAQLARRAYLSHLRAYATHPPSERHIFSIAQLQLGHLAKAFALREAPGDIRAKAQAATLREKKSAQGNEAASKRVAATAAAKRKRAEQESGEGGAQAHDDRARDTASDSDDDNDRYRNATLQFQRNKETEARMYAKVREMGSMHKRKGVLGAHGGASEFQIA